MAEALMLILGMALFVPACFTHFMVRRAVSPVVPRYRKPGFAMIPGGLAFVSVMNLAFTIAGFWLVIGSAGWWAFLCIPAAILLSTLLLGPRPRRDRQPNSRPISIPPAKETEQLAQQEQSGIESADDWPPVWSQVHSLPQAPRVSSPVDRNRRNAPARNSRV